MASLRELSPNTLSSRHPSPAVVGEKMKPNITRRRNRRRSCRILPPSDLDGENTPTTATTSPLSEPRHRTERHDVSELVKKAVILERIRDIVIQEAVPADAISHIRDVLGISQRHATATHADANITRHNKGVQTQDIDIRSFACQDSEACDSKERKGQLNLSTNEKGDCSTVIRNFTEYAPSPTTVAMLEPQSKYTTHELSELQTDKNKSNFSDSFSSFVDRSDKQQTHKMEDHQKEPQQSHSSQNCGVAFKSPSAQQSTSVGEKSGEETSTRKVASSSNLLEGSVPLMASPTLHMSSVEHTATCHESTSSGEGLLDHDSIQSNVGGSKKLKTGEYLDSKATSLPKNKVLRRSQRRHTLDLRYGALPFHRVTTPAPSSLSTLSPHSFNISSQKMNSSVSSSLSDKENNPDEKQCHEMSDKSMNAVTRNSGIIDAMLPHSHVKGNEEDTDAEGPKETGTDQGIVPSFGGPLAVSNSAADSSLFTEESKPRIKKQGKGQRQHRSRSRRRTFAKYDGTLLLGKSSTPSPTSSAPSPTSGLPTKFAHSSSSSPPKGNEEDPGAKKCNQATEGATETGNAASVGATLGPQQGNHTPSSTDSSLSGTGQPQRRSRRNRRKPKRFRGEQFLIHQKLPNHKNCQSHVYKRKVFASDKVSSKLTEVKIKCEDGLQHYLPQDGSERTEGTDSAGSVLTGSTSTHKPKRRKKNCVGIRIAKSGMIDTNDAHALESRRCSKHQHQVQQQIKQEENSTENSSRMKRSEFNLDSAAPVRESPDHRIECKAGAEETENGQNGTQWHQLKTPPDTVGDKKEEQVSELPHNSAISCQDEDTEPRSHSQQVLGISSAVDVSVRATLKKTRFADVAYVPSAADISNRAQSLFPEDNVLALPCVSSRLFASFSLVVEKVQSLTEESQGDSRIHTRNQLCFDSVTHVLPLLRAFVHAEITTGSTLLDEMKNTAGGQVDVKRKLQFCTFDYSATMPPVDTRVGSNAHLESCISSLYNVVKKMNEMSSPLLECSAQENVHTAEKFQRINDLVNFLMDIEEGNNLLLQEECSKSMPMNWPAKRFARAAEIYRNEFESMLPASGRDGIKSTLKGRLGDFIGRAIRFYLRRFFNPVPLPVTTPSQKHPKANLSFSRSRVHEMVEMTAPDARRDSAVADGSISSVFSHAIRRIHEFYLWNSEMMGEDSSEFVTSFCTSKASQNGAGTRRSVIIITDELYEDIISDIKSAQIALAGARACICVRELIRWPGVAEEIHRSGGWRSIESYAAMLSTFGLKEACPEDAYFVLLQDVDSLIHKLENEASIMEHIAQACDDSLKKMWKKCRCGTRDESFLNINPKVLAIASTLRDGKQLVFPSFAKPNYESD